MTLPAQPNANFSHWSSIYAEGEDEAHRFKWIESEKARRDLGEVALHQWSQDYWGSFTRYRWIEHLEGKRFFSELSADQFGLLCRPFTNHEILLDRIMDRLRIGHENLEIYDWAVEWHIPCGPVHEILMVLKVNEARLPAPFEQLAC